MPEKLLYEYAVIRILPSAERGEFVNVGLAMMCKRSRWLKVEIEVNHDRLRAIAGDIDTAPMIAQLSGFRSVASGQKDGGPIAQLPVEERFRWLTAVRSAALRTSRPHPGITTDLEATFSHLMDSLVR